MNAETIALLLADTLTTNELLDLSNVLSDANQTNDLRVEVEEQLSHVLKRAGEEPTT